MVEECSWWKSDICNIKIRETRNPWVSARQKWVMFLFTSDNLFEIPQFFFFFFWFHKKVTLMEDLEYPQIVIWNTYLEPTN